MGSLAAHLAEERDQLKASNRKLREEFERLREVVEFYADPEIYAAILIVPDKPCGDFIEDFSEDKWTRDLCGFDRPMPGKRARAVLLELLPSGEAPKGQSNG